MLYDLNIPWSPSTPPADLARVLAFSLSLGYDVVALNHTLTPPLGAHPTNPMPLSIPSPSPSSLNTTTTTTTSSSSTTSTSTPPTHPKILHRATIPLTDPSASALRPATLAPLYDLLAVRPTTASAFQAACVSLPDVSIISLDLSAHLGFPLRPRPVMAAISRGLRFEVCYSQFLVDDPRARSNFICNFGNLVRATRGRGIFVSSGGSAARSGGASVGNLRAPADVVNLLAVWGLNQERGREGLGPVPRGVVVNEGLKWSGFRGVVDIVQTAAADDGDDEKDKKRKRNRDGGEGNKGKGKRKNGDEDGEGGGGGGGGGGDAGTGEGAGMSKRQAKKLKLAAAAASASKDTFGEKEVAS